MESERNRPSRYGREDLTPEAAEWRSQVAASLEDGSSVSAEAVAADILAGIRNNDSFVFTHPYMAEVVAARLRRVAQALGVPVLGDT